MSEEPTHEELEPRRLERESAEALTNHSEHALGGSEAGYRDLFIANPHPMWIYDLESLAFLEVNNAAVAHYGYSRDEFLGMTIKDIRPSEDVLRLMKNIEQVDSGLDRAGIWRHIKKNGEVIDVEITSHVLPFKGRRAELVIAYDVTERIRTEDALKDSQARLRAIVRAIPDLVWLKDPKGVYLTCNSRFEQFFGAGEEEIAGKTDYDFVEKELADSFREHDRAAMARGRPSINEEEVTFAHDGHREMLETIKTPIYDSEGRLAGVLGIGRDITARKRAEEKLRESEEKLRLFIEHAPAALAMFDRQMRYLAVSHRWLADFGIDGQHVIGRSHYDIFPEIPDRWKAVHHRSLAGEVVRADEDEFLRPDGSVQWLQWEVRPWYRADGAVGGIVIFSADLTERKRMEEERTKLQGQLIQAQKMESVGRLAGGVAHDFNNMLSVIIGYAELALENLDTGDPLHADIREIFTAAKRSTRVTQQLLAFARQQTIAPKVIDLNDTVERMLAMLRRLIGEDIDLAWHPRRGLWPVKMDPTQIDQILANLCVNARDAIADVGKLTLETDRVTVDEAYCADHPGFVPGNFVVLAVSDDGCGMDRETQRNIFEPFFTTKGVGQGTGLGLATVYGIVKQNDGFINVYSEVGKGTTFKIFLPMHESHAMADEKMRDGDTPKGRGERVLVVEDETSILVLAEKILTGLGYRVLLAKSPSEALQLAESTIGEFSLLLTDVVMPGMNGRELAKRLQTLHPGLKCLYMSGYTANVIAHRGILDEDVDFIQKPFTRKDLAVKVRAVMDGQRFPPAG